MNKIYLSLIVLVSNLSLAQDLQFDPTFNSGSSIYSDYALSGTIDDYDYGPLRAINDSLYVYVAIGTDWNNQDNPAEMNVYSRIIHSDDTVEQDLVYTETILVTNGNLAPYIITDIIVGEIGQLFIVKNDVNGLGQFNVKLIKFNPYSAVNGWTLDTTFGTSGSFIVDLNTDFRDAKGVVINGIPRIYGRYNDTSTGNQLAAAYVLSGGVGFSVFTANAQYQYSNVADVIRLASGDVLLADNRYSTFWNGTNNEYTNMNRLIALNISGGLVGTFGTNGMADVTWSTGIADQATTYIDKLMQDSAGDILLAGDQRVNISGYWRSKGRLSKFTSMGALVTSFGPTLGTNTPGVYTQDYAPTFISHTFHDIHEMANGDYMVCASSIHQTNGAPDGNRAFLQVFSTGGEVSTSYVPDGFLFNTQSFYRIDDIHLQNSGKIVFIGYENLGSQARTSFGRLDWDNENAINESVSPSFTIFPNPVNSELQIDVQTPETLTIRSAQGQVIDVFAVNSTFTYDAGALSSGMYFIQSENGSTIKFIKH